MNMAFSLRFGFDVLELRKFRLLVKNKATGTPLVVYYKQSLHFCSVMLYIHRRGAFSVARFGKKGNAKASTRGTGKELAPRFLFVYKLT